MRRPALLVAVGVLLVVAGALAPVASLLAADWDSDYAYRVPEDGFCADAVADLDGDGQSDGFVVPVDSLSPDARELVRRARANGSVIVEDESGVAGPFDFTDDHVARGEGCYAIRDGDDSYPLRTALVSRRTAGLVGGVLPIVGRVAVALGVLLAFGGAGLALYRRR